MALADSLILSWQESGCSQFLTMNGHPPASPLNRLSVVILSEVELKSTSSYLEAAALLNQTTNTELSDPNNTGQDVFLLTMLSSLTPGRLLDVLCVCPQMFSINMVLFLTLVIIFLKL